MADNASTIRKRDRATEDPFRSSGHDKPVAFSRRGAT